MILFKIGKIKKSNSHLIKRSSLSAKVVNSEKLKLHHTVICPN